MIKGVFAFVFLMSAVILAHETGHFLMARLFNIKVLKFSLGFGPALLKKQVGETEYALSLLPLGGYVQMLGEKPDEPIPVGDLNCTYQSQARWKRALVIAAGPVANFILAAMILFTLYLVGIRVMAPIVGGIELGSPAEVAGLVKGDTIKEVDGVKVQSWTDAIMAIEESSAARIPVTVLRAGTVKTLTVEPRLYDETDVYGKVIKVSGVGISPEGRMVTKRYSLMGAMERSVRKTASFIAMIGDAVIKLFAGEASAKAIGGPVSIAKASSTYMDMGYQAYFLLIAILSVNLGVLNLLPIPFLDGGHLLILGIEGLKGSSLNNRLLKGMYVVGGTILILLMGTAIFNDIAGMIK